MARFLAATLGLLWGWWAWKSGAYFGAIFYPGAAALFALTIVVLVRSPTGIRLQGWPTVAFGGLLGLGGWTLLSIIWTPAEDIALADAMQVFAYGAAFLVGIWLCRLAGRRVLLAAFPVVGGAALAGLITTITLWTGDDVATYLHDDASLRFPIGYRNANAAFFLIAFWPAITLAASRWTDRWIRALSLATATMALELAVLSQSRGSLIAATASLLVYAILSPARLRVGAYLGVALIPFAAALPVLLDVYQEGVPISSAVPLLRDAAWALAISSVAAAGLGLAAFGIEDRISLGAGTARRVERTLAAAIVLLALVGSAAYVERRGGPVEFIDQRIEEFEHGGTPELHGQGTRFGTNFGSNRRDFWRVARGAAADRPLIGEGAGSFGFRYARERRSSETPSDPHSVEMLIGAELGLPGLLLFAAALLGASVGAIRSRLLGPQEAGLVAAALAAGAYWLTHASFDWFWNYPAVSAPALCLLGAACAPALLEPAARLGRWLRGALIAAAALLVVVSVPLYLSDRYTDDATSGWRDDRERAYDDLDRAQSSNPIAERPLLVEGEIALASGDPARAVAAFREAAAQQPENWVAHYRLGTALLGGDPTTAARELELARSLNPASPEIAAAQRSLRPG